ncbi:MAG: MlaD family protein [Mariprofundaceae bacterium]
MKSNKINYAVVGSFVLAILVGLIISVAMLTGRSGDTDTYFGIYENVTNIKYGTRVMFEGYPVGQVEDVQPFQEKGTLRFRVYMSILRDWKIPNDSIAQITSAGLLSAITIVIRAGQSRVMLEPGGEIPAGDQKSMFEAISSVAGETSGLIQSLNDIVTKFADKAPEITRNVTEFTAKLNKSGNQLQEVLKKENSENLSVALKNFSELSRNLQETDKKIDILLDNFTHIASENKDGIRDAVEDLRHTMASMSRHIDAISHNLEITSRNMNEFSRQIRANPGVLLSNKPPADEAEK